jgi:predicted NBD/HSP70 family sugar kinase
MYLGIDIGGTKTLVAVLSPEGEILEQVKFATPQSYPEFLITFQEHLSQLQNKSFIGAAAGVPGVFDRANDIVVSYGNLDWHNTPVKTDLEKIVGCPVAVENDGKLGGLFEAADIIDEYKNLLYLAIGTGIGICYTSNGIIDQTIDDGGGHTLMIEHNGTLEPWEDFAAGKAITDKYGLHASEITDPAAWKEIAHNFTLGIKVLLESRSPDVIIIGGGVGAHFDKFSSFLEIDLKEILGSCPPLRQAKDAEEAVVYGAYELIKQQHGQTT